MEPKTLDAVETKVAAIVYHAVFDVYCPGGHVPGSGHPGDYEDEGER